MAYEIEIITDDRFLHKYSSDDIKKECIDMVQKIVQNLNELSCYVEVYKEPYLVDFGDSKQYRALLFIQLGKGVKTDDMMEAVNSIFAPYYKRVKNKKKV